MLSTSFSPSTGPWGALLNRAYGSGYRDTDNMTANELQAEEVRLSGLASIGQITPTQAARLREIKDALRQIREAQRMW